MCGTDEVKIDNTDDKEFDFEVKNIQHAKELISKCLAAVKLSKQILFYL